jgi:uroporphyrinogen-III synthase
MPPAVGVTTDRDTVARVSTLFRDVGLEPVALPCIEIEAEPGDVCDRARDAARRAELIVITSPRTVGILWPQGGMPAVPVASVGPETASAVRAAGGIVTLEGSGGAAALVDLIGPVDGRVIVFPHAATAPSGTAERLAAAGAVVDAHAVYRARPVPPAGAAVDAVAFASPSAVRGWTLARPLDGMVVAAVGHTTADHLGSLGRPPDVVAQRPTFHSLAEAVAAHLFERRAQ